MILVSVVSWFIIVRMLYVFKVVLIENREIILLDKWRVGRTNVYGVVDHTYENGPSSDFLYLAPLIGDVALMIMTPVFLCQIFSKLLLKYVAEKRKIKAERLSLLEKTNGDPDILKAIEEVNRALKDSK